MRSLDSTTREKIREYIKQSAGGANWEANADAICYLIENGKILNAKDIKYDEDGDITKIKGTEVKDGVLQLKEKKKSVQSIVEKGDEPIPFVEDLRKMQATRRRLIVL
jgi:hypothetical protein